MLYTLVKKNVYGQIVDMQKPISCVDCASCIWPELVLNQTDQPGQRHPFAPASSLYQPSPAILFPLLRSSASLSLLPYPIMAASLTDTALFAGIIVLAIALLMILFVYAFNNSRPGIYLNDENSSQAGPQSPFSSSATVPMHQVDRPVPTQHSQSILPL
jgi:hypothetical protein